MRASFSGTNAVTYYACKERVGTGSPRNCSVIGAGTYAITTLGDARVLTVSNPPALAAALTYERVWIERGGLLHVGYRNKPVVNNTARLNTAATNALHTRLGLAAEDPSVPLALTAGSYQGTWDLRQSGSDVTPTNGQTVNIGPTGLVSCIDKGSNTSHTCSLSITNASTGAFTFADDAGGTVTGSFDFMAGNGSGTYVGADGTQAVVAGRR